MDMASGHRGVPVVHMRTPEYVFGPANPVSVVELREKLAQILEGRLTAREYHEDVLGRLRASRR